MANILGIGNVTLDIINEVSHYPERDTEQRALAQRVRVGGNVANTLTVLRQFDHQCQLGASVGVDADGERIMQELQAADLGLDYLKRPEQGHTPTSYITLDRETGSRTIVHHRELPEYDLLAFLKAEDQFTEFDWIHFEARAMEETNGMLALARGVVTDQPISLEVEKDRELLEQVWSFPDIIFFSRHFAMQRGFDQPEAFLQQAHQWAPQAQLVLGWGASGAYGFFPQNEQPLQHQPPTRHVDVIDSIGAGDTLIAGFIQARLQQMNHSAALRFAVELTERKLEQIGFARLGPKDPQNEPDLLCRLDELEPVDALGVTSENSESGIPDTIVVHINGQVNAFANICPHNGSPLAQTPRGFLADQENVELRCQWHNARFTPGSGYCTAGPCQGEHLTTVPIAVKNNRIYRQKV